jgi:hypothetical protein
MGPPYKPQREAGRSRPHRCGSARRCPVDEVEHNDDRIGFERDPAPLCCGNPPINAEVSSDLQAGSCIGRPTGALAQDGHTPACTGRAQPSPRRALNPVLVPSMSELSSVWDAPIHAIAVVLDVNS